jgi:uncharacterized protein YbjT (DUF2867 family)
MSRVLVFAATGQVGSALCELLVAEGHDVHGVTRSRASELSRHGITPITADMRDTASLAPMIAGFDAVFVASADAPDQDASEIALIELLAGQKNKPRLVKLSAQSAGLVPPVSFGVQHRRSEEALQKCGLPWTILRPTFFQQSVLLMKDDIARKGSITAPMGNGRSAMINVSDIAQVAALCLTKDGHAGKIYTLTGPEPLGFAEVTSILGDLLGRRISYVSPPAPVARLVMPLVTGMPRWQTSLIIDLMVAIRKGAQETVTQDVERLTGRSPIRMRDFLATRKQDFMEDGQA